MEGVYYTVIKLIVAEGVVSVAATLRFAFWLRRRAQIGLLDAGLLALQILLFLICLPVLVSDLVRNWGGNVLVLQTLMVLSPLAAAVLAQIAMFLCMGRGRDQTRPAPPATAGGGETEQAAGMTHRRPMTVEIVGLLAASAALAAYIVAFGHEGFFLYSDFPQSLLNDLGSLLSWIFLPGILAAVMLFDSAHDPSFLSYLVGVAAEITVLWFAFRRWTVWTAARRAPSKRTQSTSDL